jgi:hypothetical protein
MNQKRRIEKMTNSIEDKPPFPGPYTSGKSYLTRVGSSVIHVGKVEFKGDTAHVFMAESGLTFPTYANGRADTLELDIVGCAPAWVYINVWKGLYNNAYTFSEPHDSRREADRDEPNCNTFRVSCQKLLIEEGRFDE